MSSKLGIGVITYSRLEMLGACVRAVENYTKTPFDLVIADDGSTDETVKWGRDAGYRVRTGKRRGCAWNKNRALEFLLEHTDCDPILLLEDDTHPNQNNWEDHWIAACRRWQHVNFNRD